jgi:hypothetical protein
MEWARQLREWRRSAAAGSENALPVETEEMEWARQLREWRRSAAAGSENALPVETEEMEWARQLREWRQLSASPQQHVQAQHVRELRQPSARPQQHVQQLQALYPSLRRRTPPQAMLMSMAPVMPPPDHLNRKAMPMQPVRPPPDHLNRKVMPMPPPTPPPDQLLPYAEQEPPAKRRREELTYCANEYVRWVKTHQEKHIVSFAKPGAIAPLPRSDAVKDEQSEGAGLKPAENICRCAGSRCRTS